MSVHLFTLPATRELALYGGYEDGTLQLWILKEGSAEFTLKWKHRAHLESVLSTALAVDTDALRLVSTGADARVVLVTCSVREDGDGGGERVALSPTTFLHIKTETLETEKPGRACSSFLRTPTHFVVGGWDGKARVYDLQLACTRVLRYHKESIQAAASVADVIALGSKDGRVSLWRSGGAAAQS